MWVASTPVGSAPSSAETTTAPAPSPNSTQVLRSCQSMCRVRISAPISSTLRAKPLATKPRAVSRP